jgi:hypothetical protein
MDVDQTGNDFDDNSSSYDDLENIDDIQSLGPVQKVQPFRADGTLTVHLPDLQSVSVEYSRRESIEAFRARLQTFVPNLRLHEFLVVCERGSIADEATLDQYYVTPGSDVILVRKGIRNRQQLKNRAFWLKSHASAQRGEPRPLAATKLYTIAKPSRPTPSRISEHCSANADARR